MGAPSKRDKEQLQPAIRRDRCYRFLHDVELAGFHGNVVEKYRRDDNPDDFQSAKSDPVEKAGGGELDRHSENRSGAQYGGRCAGDCAKVRAHLEAGEKSQQNHNGKGCDESGEPPVAEGIVILGPSQSEPRRLRQC